MERSNARPKHHHVSVELIAPLPLRRERTRRVVLFTQAARRAVRSGVVWGSIFGIIAASSAISYTTIYSTQAERNALATAFGHRQDMVGIPERVPLCRLEAPLRPSEDAARPA